MLQTVHPFFYSSFDLFNHEFHKFTRTFSVRQYQFLIISNFSNLNNASIFIREI